MFVYRKVSLIELGKLGSRDKTLKSWRDANMGRELLIVAGQLCNQICQTSMPMSGNIIRMSLGRSFFDGDKGRGKNERLYMVVVVAEKERVGVIFRRLAKLTTFTDQKCKESHGFDGSHDQDEL